MTRKLVQVGQVLQIPLEDHIILGNDSHTSLRQNALVNFTPNRLF
jgi:DNA repair protein RadC